jgi:hypothetical protein
VLLSDTTDVKIFTINTFLCLPAFLWAQSDIGKKKTTHNRLWHVYNDRCEIVAIEELLALWLLLKFPVKKYNYHLISWKNVRKIKIICGPVTEDSKSDRSKQFSRSTLIERTATMENYVFQSVTTLYKRTMTRLSAFDNTQNSVEPGFFVDVYQYDNPLSSTLYHERRFQHINSI